KDKGVEVGGRAGFNFNVNDHIGVWGRAGVNYNHVSAPSGSASFSYLPLSAMILYHPAPHFFLGLGPYYNLKLSGNVNHNYGFTTLTGGWFYPPRAPDLRGSATLGSRPRSRSSGSSCCRCSCTRCCRRPTPCRPP